MFYIIFFFMISKFLIHLQFFFFFFFNDTATTEIYTLSLHDALPIRGPTTSDGPWPRSTFSSTPLDRKSTRLNSSHSQISYAVFCLKKKKKKHYILLKKKQKKNINHLTYYYN